MLTIVFLGTNHYDDITLLQPLDLRVSHPPSVPEPSYQPCQSICKYRQLEMWDSLLEILLSTSQAVLPNLVWTDCLKVSSI